MTVNRRIVVALEDIEIVSLECSQCKSRVSAVPEKAIRIPEYCGQCGQRWWPENASGPSSERAWAFPKFLDSLTTIRTLIASGSPPAFRLLLEFTEPKE